MLSVLLFVRASLYYNVCNNVTKMRLQDLEKSDEIRKRRKEIENEEKQIADIKRKKIELDEGGVER